MNPDRSPPKTPTRRPFQERTHSANIRVVPYTPPRLVSAASSDRNDSGGYANVYSRTPLPTQPAHFLPPAGAILQGSSNALVKTPEGVSEPATPAPGNKSPPRPHQSRPQSGQPVSTDIDVTPKAKRRLVVALNPGLKTFKVLQDNLVHTNEFQTEDDGQRSLRSVRSVRSLRSLASPTASQSSHERTSSDLAQGIDTSIRSPSSCRPESTAASSTTSLSLIKTTPLADDHITSSPWNYGLVGGLRKVAKSPDLKQKAIASPDLLPSLPETSDDTKAAHELSTKASFQSTATIDSVISSDPSNYQVYGSSSPPYPLIHPPSSRGSDHPPFDNSSIPESDVEDSLNTHSETASNPNYQVFGASSPVSGSQASVIHHQIAPSESSGNTNYQVLGYSSSPVSSELDLSNYQVYGDPSPSTSQVALTSQRANYSQDSLVVPPLRPRSKRSTEGFGYYKQRSRESLRTGSFTSITSVLSQEAFRAVLTSASVVNLQIPLKSEGSSAWANPLALHPARAPMQAHPHQWSSQLSTVPSESDGATDRGSRSFSEVSAFSGSQGRRGSTNYSHNRQMPSISSSLQRQEEARSNHYSDDLEYPQPAYAREGQRMTTGSPIRVVEDQDEYGDGLTDMRNMRWGPDLRSRSSRNRLSNLYSLSSGDDGRTNTMRSTASSRSNSLLANSIPAWARLYYGSGERRYLGVNASGSEISSMSRRSSYRDDSNSPNTSNFALNIHSPRRRPREINPNNGRPQTGDSMLISPYPELGSDGVLIPGNYRSKWRTSSIWSPHLGVDRRATSRRMTVWDGAPSINFSTETGMFGRRNRQLVMFIVGFIFPFGKFRPP
jgi:hypothetical protein